MKKFKKHLYEMHSVQDLMNILKADLQGKFWLKTNEIIILFFTLMNKWGVKTSFRLYSVQNKFKILFQWKISKSM